MDGELNVKKNFTEASGPSNELVLKVLKDLKSFPSYVKLNDLKRLFRLLFHPPSPELGDNFRHVSIFQSINSALIFVKLTRV